MVPSVSALIVKAIKKLPRDRKKQEKKKHQGEKKVSFDFLPDGWSFARDLLGTIALSVDCSVDGHHPHDIIDDISGGVVECQLRSNRRKYFNKRLSGGKKKDESF